MEFVKRFVREEEGQGLTEYALILGLVILGVWVGVVATGLDDAISNIFADVTTQAENCTPGSCGD